MGGVGWACTQPASWLGLAFAAPAQTERAACLNRYQRRAGTRLTSCPCCCRLACLSALQSRACPSCGGPLSLKFSSKARGSPFVGCSRYPECEYSRPISSPWMENEAKAAAVDAGAEDAADGEVEVDADLAAILQQHGIKGAQGTPPG